MHRRAFLNLRGRCHGTVGLRRGNVVGGTRHLFTRIAVSRTEHRLRSTQGSLGITRGTLGILLGIRSTVSVGPDSPLFVGRSLPSRLCFGGLMDANDCVMDGLQVRRTVTSGRLGVDGDTCVPAVTLFKGRALCTRGLPGGLVPHALMKINFA